MIENLQVIVWLQLSESFQFKLAGKVINKPRETQCIGRALLLTGQQEPGTVVVRETAGCPWFCLRAYHSNVTTATCSCQEQVAAEPSLTGFRQTYLHVPLSFLPLRRPFWDHLLPPQHPLDEGVQPINLFHSFSQSSFISFSSLKNGYAEKTILD